LSRRLLYKKIDYPYIYQVYRSLNKSIARRVLKLRDEEERKKEEERRRKK
jgi:hypothetical protein